MCAVRIAFVVIIIVGGSINLSAREHVTLMVPFSEIPPLRNVPSAEDLGIIMRTRLLPMPATINGCFNASIIRKDYSSYLLAVRHPSKSLAYRSAIYLLTVNRNFVPQGNPIYINTGVQNAEDPRLFWYEGHPWLTHTIAITQSEKQPRAFTALAPIGFDGTKYRRTTLRYRGKPIEKNWVPFEYVDDDGISNLFFVYYTNPWEIIRYTPSGRMEQYVKIPVSNRLKNIWENRWGEIRGGTPAFLVDGDYLTFFHSLFVVTLAEKKRSYYVFGALRFESKPPFRQKSISRFPLLFKECYTAKVTPFPWFYKFIDVHAIFPCGFVVSRTSSGSVFHLLCGENDSAVRLITINKQKLFRHMVAI